MQDAINDLQGLMIKWPKLESIGITRERLIVLKLEGSEMTHKFGNAIDMLEFLEDRYGE